MIVFDQAQIGNVADFFVQVEVLMGWNTKMIQNINFSMLKLLIFVCGCRYNFVCLPTDQEKSG